MKRAAAVVVGSATVVTLVAVAIALWRDYDVARSAAYGLMLLGALIVFVAPGGLPMQRLDSFRGRDMDHFHARLARTPTVMPLGFLVGTLLAGLGVLVFFAAG